jgi:methylase of polypeptide subunit release factors
MQALAYRKLSELVDRFRRSRSVNADAWTKKLFETLDWGDRPTFAIRPNNGEGYRLFVDNFPVINVLTESPNNVDSVYRALNKAYNQDVPWVVATDFYSLGIFGTYWVSFPHDISSALALKIEHSDYLAEAHQLDLLSPQSIVNNNINELYSAYAGRKRRIPIDRHLVERMQGWRQLGLDVLGNEAVNADPLVHRLINTLFLIRYLEDTRKTDLPSLREIAAHSDDDFNAQLQTNFAQTAQRTGYNVPSPEELRSLVQTPLKNLINQLYGYPEYGILYDFAAMNVDVLGRFYEEYLRHDIVPAQESKPRRGLFEPAVYELDDIRRQRGVYFTPPFLVDYLLNNLIERFRAHSPRKLPIITDIAAGSGTFLSSAVDHLLKAYPKALDQPIELANSLVGLDVDVRATDAARLNLTAKLIGVGAPEPLPPLHLKQVDLIMGGTSAPEIVELLPEGADIIVGNPPYISYERLKNQYSVTDFSEMFETAVGRTDSYIMFLEAAIKLLKDGGFGGLVLPNSILRTQAAGRLRQWFVEQADVLEIIDFLEQPVFQSVNAYICLLLFRKRSAETISRDATIAKIYDLSETPATQLANISVLEKLQEGVEVFRINQPAGRGPWLLRNKAECELLEIIKNQSDQVVSEVVTLRQGVKTGNDGVFIVEVTPINDGSYMFHGEASLYQLEKELLLPVLRNRDLRRWGARPKAFLIYPYNRTTNRVLSWTTLKRDYPGVANYLEKNREALARRKSLRGRKAWYELIEPRLATVTSDEPHLLAAEIGLRPIICKTDAPNTAIVGNAWLTLLDDLYDLDVLMAYLNSSVSEWHLRQLSPLLQGGYILLRQTNLSKLPVPRFLKDNEAFSHGELKRLSIKLGEKAVQASSSPHILGEIKKTEEQIDSIIMEALGLKMSQAEQIRKANSLTRRASYRVK